MRILWCFQRLMISTYVRGNILSIVHTRNNLGESDGDECEYPKVCSS